MVSIRKLLVILMIFGIIGTFAATGAFTTVEAERTADINVGGDAGALLGITPNDNATNDFIQQSSTADSQIAVALGGGDGLNTNAATTEEQIITVTNNGQQTVSFYIATEGGLQDGSIGTDNQSNPSTNENVSDNVNVEFYVDNDNVVSQVPAKAGNVLRPAGPSLKNKEQTDPSVTLASEVGDSNDGLDTFADEAKNFGNKSAKSDYSISHQGEPDPTLPGDSGAVQLPPGESVLISVYVEIDPSSNIDLSNQNIPVVENIVFIASEDINGNLVSEKEEDAS